MNTIIEKIRAEVNRLQHTDIPHTDEWWAGADYVRRRMKDVLSDLEKEEKPMNPQPVKIDIRKELASIEFMGVNDARDTETIARHFYELGKQSKEQPLLPGFENEQPGIPGKDFVPVAWCDALEQYGIWRIERVEQPVSEGLKEEINRWMGSTDCFPEGVGISPLPKAMEIVEKTARHFSQWGAEHRGSSEIPNDLEEAAKKHSCYDEDCEGAWYEPIVRNAFIAGAKWQKEQMMDEWLKDRDGCFWDGVEEGKKAMREQLMKEAVEGEVIKTDKHTSVRYKSFYGTYRYFYGIADKQFKPGDKGRIIFVKED